VLHEKYRTVTANKTYLLIKKQITTRKVARLTFYVRVLVRNLLPLPKIVTFWDQI